MFEWLEEEICEIGTPRFHLVQGPADERLRNAITSSVVPLPSSYIAFVLRFGDARLYRRSRDGYRIGVFAGPRRAQLDDGTDVFHVGYFDTASVYVKLCELSSTPVLFQFDDGAEQRIGTDFEDWLRESCKCARQFYGTKEWADILRRPKPFTAEEKKMIETRRRIGWRVLGVDQEGNHIFEVSNHSERTLASLTVGLRSSDRRLNGAIRLRVEEVLPGQTSVLHADCYKDLKPPTEIEAFELPDPQPEDRPYYYEFEKSG
jgi:hypothetical protein